MKQKIALHFDTLLHFTFTSNWDTMGFINNDHVLVPVQHASVEVFGQHVRMNFLQLQTEPFQLHHPPLLPGHCGLGSMGLRLLLSDFLGKVDRSQPGFLSRVGAWSVFRGGGLAPAAGRCFLRTPAAVCPWFDPRQEGVEAGAPVSRTGSSSTDVHYGLNWSPYWHEQHAVFTMKSLPGRAFQNKSAFIFYFILQKRKKQTSLQQINTILNIGMLSTYFNKLHTPEIIIV